MSDVLGLVVIGLFLAFVIVSAVTLLMDARAGEK